MDEEDLIKKILDGLDDECKELIWAMQAYETLVKCMELHENLLNLDTFFQAISPQSSFFSNHCKSDEPKC